MQRYMRHLRREEPAMSQSPTDTVSYQAALLQAALLREARLSGSSATRYQTLYRKAARLGTRLRRWRGEQRLDRTGAAQELRGWTRTSLTLFEQGLLLPTELSSEMIASLRTALES